MPQSKAQKEATRKYRAEKTSSVQVQLTIEDKAEWTAYAQSRGLPLATLIREAMKNSMLQHDWHYETNEKEEDGEASQE